MMTRHRGLEITSVRTIVIAAILLTVFAVSLTTMDTRLFPIAERHLDDIGLLGNSCQWDVDEDECVGELRKCRTIGDEGLCGSVIGCRWTDDGYCIDGPVREPTCAGLDREQCRSVP